MCNCAFLGESHFAWCTTQDTYCLWSRASVWFLLCPVPPVFFFVFPSRVWGVSRVSSSLPNGLAARGMTHAAHAAHLLSAFN